MSATSKLRHANKAKPHLFMFGYSLPRRWRCIGGNVAAYGASPAEAHREWLLLTDHKRRRSLLVLITPAMQKVLQKIYLGVSPFHDVPGHLELHVARTLDLCKFRGLVELRADRFDLTCAGRAALDHKEMTDE